MAKNRPLRTPASDVTSYEIVIKTDSGEAVTMTVADFLREHAARIACDVIECLQAGESVTVTTQGGSYTIRLLRDDDAVGHGRFVSPRGRPPAGEWVEAAPQHHSELEAVG